jgi:hypothetical protein
LDYDLGNFKVMYLFAIHFQELCNLISREYNDESHYYNNENNLSKENSKEVLETKNQYLSDYINDFLPNEDFAFTPWYQNFCLIGKNQLFSVSPEGWIGSESWSPEQKYVLIGQDTSDGFIGDYSDEKCPIFLYSEVNDFQPERLADSLYDFVFLLQLREYDALLESLGGSSEILQMSEFAQNYDLSRLDYHSWLRQLAPNYMKNWH